MPRSAPPLTEPATDPAALRDRAVQLRRMIFGIGDPATHRTLREMAAELDARAAALERTAPSRPYESTG